MIRPKTGHFFVSIAAFAAVVCLGAAYYAEPRNPIARLARVKLTSRPVEARFCGFRWAPVGTQTSGRSSLELTMIRAISDVFRTEKRDGQSSHAIALAHAFSGNASKAALILETLAAGTQGTVVWSDLAAARYAAAVATNRPEDLVPALAAADTALRLNGEHPEARFNRALIVERLGLRDPAISAWNSFLDLDGTSEWAVEARAHLKTLSIERPKFPGLSEPATANPSADAARMRDLTAAFPQDARLAVEREVLARWGEATKANDHVAAMHELTIAKVVGAELARMTGDRMVERAVGAIEHADRARLFALASGHLDFTSALKTFRSGRPGEAEPVFERAARELDRGGSPFAFMARFFASYVRYEQGLVAASTRELQQLLSEVPPDLLTCHATILWQLAICFGAEARWGEDIEAAEASLANFVRANERANAAMLREHIAQAYDLIGDPLTAWSYRAAALPELGRTSTRFLQAGVLGFLAQEALFRRDWAEAASFVELELEVGKTARYSPGLADGRLRRALIRHHFADPDSSDDISRARTIIAAIPDPGMRLRLDARAVAVEAMVARTPAEAVPLLTTAIEFHASARGQRMFLPSLLLHRARAQRALRQTSMARRDLDAAIAELDSGRESLHAAEQRVGMFESAEGVLDEAIDLALEERDVAGAFAYAEHARARSLLDAMRSSAPAGIRLPIPAGTVVVEYSVLPSRVVIFVLEGTDIRVATRTVDRDTVAERAAAFAEALSRGDAGHSVGTDLYRDLFAPIAGWIRADASIVIVPDSTTAAIPFAALPLPGRGFLVQRHMMLTAPSAAVFARGAATRNRFEGDERLLLVVTEESGSVELDPLPAASDEARRISGLYRSVRSLWGRTATREGFLREVGQASVIHFAGHALSSEYRPEETAIVLSGPDGRMNIRDIARLQLDDCSAVVLAACSTARGKVRRYEGTMSVARAFLTAGAPSVVATLWPIDDGEASRFFPIVHEQLARGVPAMEALRAAQLEAIRNESSPSLWAAVQVIGR